MICDWQIYDKHVTNLWQTHDENTTNYDIKYDKHMTKIWQTYDEKYDKHMIQQAHTFAMPHMGIVTVACPETYVFTMVFLHDQFA